MRDAAKTITLAVSYGMGSGNLSEKLGCSLNEAREHLDSFFAAFPQVAAYRDTVSDRATMTGYSASIGGRRRVFRALPPPQRSQYIDGFRAALEQWRISESRMRRQSVNHTIQGTGADILKLAMALTFQRLPRYAPGAHLVAAVHEELLVEAPIAVAGSAGSVLERAMEEAARFYLPTVALGEFHALQASYWRKE